MNVFLKVYLWHLKHDYNDLLKMQSKWNDAVEKRKQKIKNLEMKV